MCRVAIGPTDRLGRFFAAMDIATNLARQVGDGREDAARQEVALDLGKPEFDLVEPGRVGRREMQMYVPMFDQERPHGLRLVGREVVRDDVDLSTARLAADDLAEEVDEH